MPATLSLPTTSGDLRPWPERDAAFLVEAGILLAEAANEEEALARLAGLIVPRLADWCVFDMLQPNGAVRRAVVAQADPQLASWARTLEERYPIDPSVESNVVVRVLRTGRSDLTSEVPDEVLVASARDAEHLHLLRALGIRSHLIVPLSVRGETLGAVTFIGAESGRRYGADDLALAEALARQTAVAIDGARRREAAETARLAAERAAARTAHLQMVTAALGRAVTPVEVAKVVVEQGIAALGARAMSVQLLDPTGQELETVAITGYSDDQVRSFQRVPCTSPLPSAVAVRTGEALWESSRDAYVAANPGYDYRPTADGDYAVAGVPLEVEGRVIGALGISFAAPRDFTQDDRDFGLALARQCAQALERARLYQAEREARDRAEQERRRIAFLAEAGAVLAGSLDLDETLSRVADLVVPALGDWCAIDVATDDGALRRVEVRCADSGQAALAAALKARAPVPGRQAGAGHVFVTGTPQLVPEVDDAFLRAVAWDEEHVAMLHQVGFRSYLGVPLAARDRIFGVLSLLATESGRRFGPDDLVLAEALARRIALAIDNARLYREQVEARARVQALAAERARILGQIADGVLLADATGRITFINGAARRLQGEPVIEPPVDLATYIQTYRVRTAAGHPLSPDAFPLKRALDSGETVVNAIWRLRRPRGEDLVVEGSAAPILADDGTLLGAVQTFQDVTERRTFEQERDTFIATVTHDLKTPLTSVKGWAQLLLSRATRDPERGRDRAALAAIVEQAGAMQRLIERLLETARDGGVARQPRVRRQPVDLVELTSWLVAIHQGMTDRHLLHVEGAKPGEVVGCFDPDMLRQILGNLLSNAIKYSPDGGPIVVVVGRDGQEARVAVHDQGIGIPADAMPSVFSQYFRADNAVRVTSGAPSDGQGLGLFSAQNLAARHGGRIEVESTEGVGSTFTLVLPLDSRLDCVGS